MKRLLYFVGAILLFTACSNKNETSEKVATDAKSDLPYTLENPYRDWQPGDKGNVAVVMNMIKAWETKNVAECTTYFADSAIISLDYYHKKLPNDSIASLLNMSLSDIESVTIKMEDWESVISGDKKEEWVTVWYKQRWINKKGVADSLNITNDARIVNGKIAIFDEKIQHFPAAAK